MNLETLKKYWNELEHYKNGGSLLARIWITDDNDGDESYTIWYKVGCECWDINKVYNYTLDYHKVQIIINDEYSIYRKALAEGKTIQLNEAAKFSDSNKGWNDLSCTSLGYSKDLFPVDYYRIKPNEPKFKVGDFVRYVNSSNSLALEINNINCGRYYFVNSNISCLEHELIPWEPIKDEWCWFWDITNEYSHLSQFNSIARGQYQSSSYEDWYCCEPFLNSKPSYLRDK